MKCHANTVLPPLRRAIKQRDRQEWVGVLLLAASGLAHAQAWPAIAIPKEVETFDAGGQMRANGLPLRLSGLLSASPPPQVAARFRDALGQPLVENTLASKLVLGKAIGEFYVTVQLEPVGAGTRGFIAISKLSAAFDRRSANPHSGNTAKSRFLAGSTLIRQVESVDGEKRARLLVLRNGHDTDLNIEHLKNSLGKDGFALEREETAPPSGPGRPGYGKTLFFKRQDEEAIAVIYRERSGGTAIVFNTVGYLEHSK
ncbi:hypothetical protein ACFOLJ_27820 [Rugamonas sp. CCM 8940]|uniref:hypothetical protein n=1 Tax=Rugamonas sp. CCM 8940 TaxID=2765359 RepID=UPI0018F5EFDF|nr:hypothetical protein [Rugamonas sp. CCM 8940]MBJ7311280.1 hypothetical protein [Rugamonas sp. CCM 8940]